MARRLWSSVSRLAVHATVLLSVLRCFTANLPSSPTSVIHDVIERGQETIAAKGQEQIEKSSASRTSSQSAMSLLPPFLPTSLFFL